MILLVPLLLCLSGCADEASSNANASEAAIGGTDNPMVGAAPGKLVERPPLLNSQQVTIRGAMRWNAPSEWKEKDTSGKPFVSAEYYLPGNDEAHPSMCRMRNGSVPKAGVDLEKAADKKVSDVRVKTTDGKSLASKVVRTRKNLGQFDWAIGSADGAWYDDGTFLKPRDPVFIVEGYTGFVAAPIAPGPPFTINCWGPSRTIESQRPAIDAWLASIKVDPIS